jgi:hypothetical protein
MVRSHHPAVGFHRFSIGFHVSLFLCFGWLRVVNTLPYFRSSLFLPFPGAFLLLIAYTGYVAPCVPRVVFKLLLLVAMLRWSRMPLATELVVVLVVLVVVVARSHVCSTIPSRNPCLGPPWLRQVPVAGCRNLPTALCRPPSALTPTAGYLQLHRPRLRLAPPPCWRAMAVTAHATASTWR